MEWMDGSLSPFKLKMPEVEPGVQRMHSMAFNCVTALARDLANIHLQILQDNGIQ